MDLKLLSEIIGWLYTFIWSIAFYGQVKINYDLKSVEGYDLNFQAQNISGFTAYTFYTLWGYYWPNQSSGYVPFQDFLFAFHGILCVLFMQYQCTIYERGVNKIQSWCYKISFMYWSVAIILGVIYFTSIFQMPDVFNLCSWFGYIKIMVTCIKYVPQVFVLDQQAYWNYKRKSTYGWSMFYIYSDAIGGGLSLCQMVLDSLIQFNTYNIFINNFNLSKFMLAFISLSFDFLFLTQHFILYGANKIQDTRYVLRNKQKVLEIHVTQNFKMPIKISKDFSINKMFFQFKICLKMQEPPKLGQHFQTNLQNLLNHFIN